MIQEYILWLVILIVLLIVTIILNILLFVGLKEDWSRLITSILCAGMIIFYILDFLSFYQCYNQYNIQKIEQYKSAKYTPYIDGIEVKWNNFDALQYRRTVNDKVKKIYFSTN